MVQPEKVFKHGAVSASVFVNAINKNGKSFEVSKVSLQRGYKDKSGQWQNTGSLDVNDIPKAIMALTRVYYWLTAKEGE